MAEVIGKEPALNAFDEIADHIVLGDYDAACRLVIKVFEKMDCSKRTQASAVSQWA